MAHCRITAGFVGYRLVVSLPLHFFSSLSLIPPVVLPCVLRLLLFVCSLSFCLFVDSIDSQWPPCCTPPVIESMHARLSLSGVIMNVCSCGECRSEEGRSCCESERRKERRTVVVCTKEVLFC